MAIVQISRITNRTGLQEDLPQLDGGELGWAVDSRRLYIGNGTLDEGAPVVGNTEILTEFSDITVLSDYTYEDIVVGYAAQTGPTSSDPVIRSVQAKLDDQASVRDFGATGDGSTDDTAAINRALFQLFCRDPSSLTRRSLFFPAGIYKITAAIKIPPYAKIFGEGADSTIIRLDSASPPTYMVQFADSQQQTESNIGTNGATAPQNIEISSVTFSCAQATNILQVAAASRCWFNSVNFLGPYTVANLQAVSFAPDGANDYAAVRFYNKSGSGPAPVLTCQDITFNLCRFSGLAKAIDTDIQVTGINVTNCTLQTLYYGIALGRVTISGTGPSGFRVLHNRFDAIFAQAVIFDDCNLNISAYNLYQDVADQISVAPYSPVITFGNDNNISVGDMFVRSDSDVTVGASAQPRISITGSATDSGSGIQLGHYGRARGRILDMIDGGNNQTIVQVNINQISGFVMDYFLSRGTVTRVGYFRVIAGSADGSTENLTWADDFSEIASTQVTLNATRSGDLVTLFYTATLTGTAPSIKYSLSYLN